MRSLEGAKVFTPCVASGSANMQRCLSRRVFRMSCIPKLNGYAVRNVDVGFLRQDLPYVMHRGLVQSSTACAARPSKARDTPALSSPDHKAEALGLAIKEINARFGKNSVMQLGEHRFGEVKTTPSGALTLDIALGGGYPVGRVVEISGPEASGKTTLALHAMAQIQKRGGAVALIDAEHAFDPVFAQRIGLDVSQLYLCQPDSGEMALEVADSLMRSGAVEMVAVDSVAALVPRAELEGEIGQTQIGSQARLMSSALRKIAGNASRHNCTIVFLNQIRLKVGVLFGNPETTSGGMALKYYSSVRLEVRAKEKIMGSAGVQTGIRIRAKCTKNKVAPPYRQAEFDLMFGTGINEAGCILDGAEKVGIVTRRGAYYYYGERRLGQGRDRALETLVEEPQLLAEIESRARDALLAADGAIGGVVDDVFDPQTEDGSAANGEEQVGGPGTEDAHETVVASATPA